MAALRASKVELYSPSWRTVSVNRFLIWIFIFSSIARVLLKTGESPFDRKDRCQRSFAYFLLLDCVMYSLNRRLPWVPWLLSGNVFETVFRPVCPSPLDEVAIFGIRELFAQIDTKERGNTSLLFLASRTQDVASLLLI
jgi:hypothetical protein